MSEETEPDISKLPKWAQEHIRDLKRERDEAVKALNKFEDNQTPSPIYTWDMISTGESVGPTTKVRYIQSNHVEIEWQGVGLTVLLRDDRIDLSWRSLDRRMSVVPFVPTSFQSADLFQPQNLGR